MPSQNYSTSAGLTSAPGFLTANVSRNWASNKSGRKVILRESPLQDSRSFVTSRHDILPGVYNGCLSAGQQVTFAFTSEHETAVYARMIGKLKQGGASMGVTLASWGQSREMIVSRLTKVSNILGTAEKNLKKMKPKQRPRALNARASDVLEVEFGWRPLVQDIHASLTTVCSQAIPLQRVTARSRFVVSSRTDTRNFGSNTGQLVLVSGYAGMSASASVQISNPNLWLLNRLGLINPATVIWDLVPWSFVVNMFLNVNQMIESVTDTVGLDITGASITRSSHLLREHTVLESNPRGYSSANTVTHYRNRSLGALPRPSWQLKVPKLDWELALIASSLVVQRFTRVTKLLR